MPEGLEIDSTSGAISGTATVPGAFSPIVTVVDAYGSRAARTLALSVLAASPKPPRITALRQSATRWRLGNRLARLVSASGPAARKGGVPIGTVFRFTLDQAARVSLRFGHAAHGRRVAGVCVAETSGNANKPRCTRTLGDGVLRVSARRGASILRFDGH